MRSRAPLAMMEQMLMLLVFALAAALCLQAFVKSDELSVRSEARDQAVIAAQNAAEAVRRCKGDFSAAVVLLGGERWDADSFTIDYNEDWEPLPAEDVMEIGSGGVMYLLGVARTDGGVPGLGKAVVWVKDMERETELFRMETAWQEVDGNG